MQQSHPQPQSGAGSRSYKYSPQATEDQDDDIRENATKEGRWPLKESHSIKTPDYKPTPLRWPFIIGVVVMLCVSIALIVYAAKAMPDSDSDAEILGLNPSTVQPRRLALARSDSASDLVSSTTPTPSSTGLGLGVQAAPSVTSPTTSLISPSGVALTNLPSNVIPISTSVSFFTTSVTVPASTTFQVITLNITVTSTYVTQSTSLATLTSTSTGRSTLHSFFPNNGTQASTAFSTQTSESEALATTVVVIPVTATLTATKEVVSTSAITIQPTVIPEVGSVTITYYSTIIPNVGQTPIQESGGQTFENPQSLPPPHSDARVEVTGAVVIQGTTDAVVQTQAPLVVVASTDLVRTEVYTPPAKTGVVSVGGVPVTSLLVITPLAVPQVATVNRISTIGGTPVTVVNQENPSTIETMIDGTLRTVVETPPPQTVISIAGGTLTTIQAFSMPLIAALPVTYTVLTDIGGALVTQLVVSTPVGPPYQPISYTVVDTIDGRPVTRVVVTTPVAASFQPVYYTVTSRVGGTATVITITPPVSSVVSIIDGKPVTIFTTPPVTSFTTTVGGTLTTETLVTLPTGTDPITLTFVSTSGDTLSTYTSTFAPTTFETTVSGSLATITSTPSPSTSFSTRSKSTRSFTSTSTDKASTTSASSGPSDHPNVVASTRVYSWTKADIFLGTFLPPLIGVALVIPLRIIDLNAKLYQPFQSLARDGGAFGEETLTMQYTGLMTFITPVATLLQGNPVPFLTTLMVGCASFIVPLATEAIGLKLHGYCYLGTASDQCGPALGVSPAPAYTLIAVIVTVILLLLLVLFFVRRRATGLFANPWNIAGIASLAGNTQIHIRQNSERAMRAAVSQKQYGLGHFRNSMGREEYGILLMDESGQGLHDQIDHGADSDSSDGLIDVDGTVAKSPSHPLPFLTLRRPWRIALVLFQLAILIFIIYYEVYYHGKVYDSGRLWRFMNSNAFGVRFVSAVIGVIIAFCWQSFFLSVSIMAPYQLMTKRTQPAERSILVSPCTNPFSGIYSAFQQKHVFLFATSFAAILSEFLPVLLSNVPFSLTQTSTAAMACAVMSAVFLTTMIVVLIGSFFSSHILHDLEGVSQLDGKERHQRVKDLGNRYYYGVIMGGSWRRFGVDCSLGTGENVDTEYRGNRIDEPPALHEPR
ncbi:hypothetical protein B0T17DRAFT_506730 [Bombardia bombarda]|uniref:Zonadhesin n=1 Tax=Bombardia bombarda TaxID=252184 RepID=A0AA40C9P1_9PEZI|nr:hypothetical protein B0T17DRAFT_506730 [Bombardia bombarda]